MRHLQISLLLCIVAFATGCPLEPSKNFNRKDSLVNSVNDRLKAYQTDYNTNVTKDPVEAQRQRNDALELSIAIIDDNYTDYIRTLDSRKAKIDFVADVIDLGTSAAVGITKGERPNQILGIALTAFRGGRNKAELEFYKQQTTPILISKMDGNRADVLGEILQKKAKPVSAYSMNEAIRDIVGYYNSGTLIRAFTKLSTDTAAQTKKSEDDLVILKRNAGVLGAPSEAEMKASAANAKSIRDIAGAYKTEKDKISDADKKIDEANKKIAVAEKTISDENAKPNPVQTVIKTATENKTAAEGDKTTANTARTAAITARDAALEKLKATYQAVEDDPALSLLLDQIPGIPGLSAEARESLRASLQRAKEKNATGEDYAQILGLMNRIVVRNLTKDPTLNERLQSILAATNK